jgi:hypothetical protein
MIRARPFLLGCAASLALAASACGGSESNDAPADSGAAETIVPVDTGADVSPDAVDAPTDAGPVRKLVDVPFGDGLPMDDRFLDPLFDMSASAWFFYDPTGTADTVWIEKRALPRAPAGQFALWVPGRSGTVNPHGVSVGGMAKLGSTAHEVSVWIGTVGTAKVNLPSLVALDPAGSTLGTAFRLKADTTSAVDMDGVHWVKWSASIAKGPLGFAFFIATVGGDGGAYFHAPLLQSVAAGAIVHPAPGRPVTAAQASVLRRALLEANARPPKVAPPTLPQRP